MQFMEKHHVFMSHNNDPTKFYVYYELPEFWENAPSDALSRHSSQQPINGDAMNQQSNNPSPIQSRVSIVVSHESQLPLEGGEIGPLIQA